MKSLQQLTLSLLVVISLLSFSPYAMPRWGPILDEPNGLSEQASDPDNYVVFAKNSTDKDQTTAIGKLLESVVSDPKNISVHGSSHVGVSFWAVPLTAEDAEKVRADPNVRRAVHLIHGALYTNDPRLAQLSDRVPKIVPTPQTPTNQTRAIPIQSAPAVVSSMRAHLS